MGGLNKNFKAMYMSERPRANQAEIVFNRDNAKINKFIRVCLTSNIVRELYFKKDSSQWNWNVNLANRGTF